MHLVIDFVSLDGKEVLTTSLKRFTIHHVTDRYNEELYHFYHIIADGIKIEVHRDEYDRARELMKKYGYLLENKKRKQF